MAQEEKTFAEQARLVEFGFPKHKGKSRCSNSYLQSQYSYCEIGNKQKTAQVLKSQLVW